MNRSHNDRVNPETLAFDAQRTVHEQVCTDCHGPYRLVQGQLTRHDTPYAVYYAGCHEHESVREVLIDVILGWAGPNAADRVTFGCRVGPVPGEEGPVATLTTAAAAFDDDPAWGRKLTEADASADFRLPEFWDAVDFVLIHDPMVRPHVYDVD